MASEQSELVGVIGQVALGDRSAFKLLYDQTAPQVLGLLMSMLQSRDLAEDVLQDTYLKVWHRAADYHQGRGQVTTWLSSIARYRALDIMRASAIRKGEATDADDTLDEISPSAMQAVAANLENSRLQTCLETLSSDQRQSIGLAYYRGFTHDELAAQLAVPLGTVKAWIRRGLQKLRECMEP